MSVLPLDLDGGESLPLDLAERLLSISGRLADMKIDPKDAAGTALACETAIGQLKDVAAECKETLAAALDKARKARMVGDGPGDDQVLVERTEGTSTSVDQDARDDLLGAVLRHAAKNRRVHPSTGELLSVAETQLEDVRECFRLEPRWTPLAKRGVVKDEYAKTTRTKGVKVSPL